MDIFVSLISSVVNSASYEYLMWSIFGMDRRLHCFYYMYRPNLISLNLSFFLFQESKH